MHSLTRSLAVVSVAALAACGGGSGSAPAVTPAVQATAASKAAATATARVTIKFPKTAMAYKKGTAVTRKPAFVSPTGGSIVVMVNGQAVGDPNNSFAPYFVLTGTNSDGTVNINVPLVPGYYNPQSITFTEYLNAVGNGTVLAYGYNAQYTDPNTGSQMDGSANISAGNTANLIVTMAMNVANLAITNDPINGSGATLLDPSTPTSVNTSDGQVQYIVPTDATGLFVVPGASGYLGGDNYNGITTIPQVMLQSSSPSGATLVAVPGTSSAYVYKQPSCSGSVTAYFSASNPLGALYPAPPFTVYSAQGAVNLSYNGC